MILAIGLRPSERRRLELVPGVRPHFLPLNDQHAARRRMLGFQEIVEHLPPDAPVAYWDVGDVVFQAPLAPLWELVRRHPDKLLLVSEPITHLGSPFVTECIHTISDPDVRRRTLDEQRRALNHAFGQLLKPPWTVGATCRDS